MTTTRTVRPRYVVLAVAYRFWPADRACCKRFGLMERWRAFFAVEFSST